MRNTDHQTNNTNGHNGFPNGQNNEQSNPQNSKSKRISNKMNIESDDSNSDDELMNLMQKNRQNNATQSTPKPQVNVPNRKIVPQPTQPQVRVEMQIQQKKIKMLSYGDLEDQVKFYLTQVYQFSGNKLFITGLMENGQTINLVANDTYRQLYFALKKEEFDSEQLSEDYLVRAKKQIDEKLKREDIQIVMGEFENRQYVFEIEGVLRSERPYYKVRYSFTNDNVPTPDWEGDYFKYVFGTTYTPLELFIMNTGVKGPSWVKVNKNFLKETKNSKTHSEGSGLSLQIQFPEGIQVIKDNVRPPFLRVMSLSLKAAVPSQLSKKQLFPNTNRIDQTHIYCISYTFCEEYQIELKPPKYNQIQKTLYLKSFGNLNEKNFENFETESQMIAKFLSDLNRLDPDAIVCHDASRILDTLIQRMAQLGDKNTRPKLGRLNHYYNLSTANQHQRISSALAGRLLVDTFIHSKDMIKSVDYELQTMSKFIKPEKNFSGMSDQEVKNNLQSGRTLFVLKKIRDEADVAFALMNHLQVLQLTKNLSNICGNLWRRSLQNQRAERNEYLIMHQCVKRGLIIPDKFKNFKNEEQGQQTDKKKYTGGMVIQPKKGMYNDFIILLDFNSLYPSIIREYNVCFSKLERPRIPLSKFYKARKNNKKTQKIKQQEKQENQVKNQHNDEEQVINPPPKEQCIKQKWGFLPRLIDGIVNQRQKCKKAMKTASAEKCIILDIQQKSYKIVANSIYGCLGFSISRFYSKPMAALITRMGRQALQRANDIVSARGGVEVIYGDTDSLMIQPTSLNKETDKEKLFEIKAIADELKKSINKEYTNLEIDIDGIFKPILLLMKKKYVANKLQNFDKIILGLEHELKFNLQYKGIEVARRDGCQLSRTSLRRILEILMNSKKSEVTQIYEQVYEYVRDLKEKLPSISPKDFLFSKVLNKKPKEYANAQTLPHVKVAMDRIKNGQKEETLVNHTIYYLVCKQKLESQDSIAKRCFDERYFERTNKFAKDPSEMLEIDVEYYKQEIMQPWMRIFMHLEEFNQDRLFEAFDVKDADRKKIKKLLNNEIDLVEQSLQDVLTNDLKQKSRKFNEQIEPTECGNCKNKIQFSQKGEIITRCPFCPIDNTKHLTSMLSNKISLWIKQHTSLYYTNKSKCQCQKVYPLTLISKCCRLQTEKKTTIPFEVHSFIYLATQVIEVTLKKLNQKLNGNMRDENQNQNENENYSKDSTTEAIKKLKSIHENLLGKYLQESDYENLKGVFDMFRI